MNWMPHFLIPRTRYQVVDIVRGCLGFQEQAKEWDPSRCYAVSKKSIKLNTEQKVKLLKRLKKQD